MKLCDADSGSILNLVRISVWNYVRKYANDSFMDLVNNSADVSVRISINNSVYNSVWISVWGSIRSSICDSIRGSDETL